MALGGGVTRAPEDPATPAAPAVDNGVPSTVSATSTILNHCPPHARPFIPRIIRPTLSLRPPRDGPHVLCYLLALYSPVWAAEGRMNTRNSQT